jgi:hypothetical protein
MQQQQRTVGDPHRHVVMMRLLAERARVAATANRRLMQVRSETRVDAPLNQNAERRDPTLCPAWPCPLV